MNTMSLSDREAGILRDICFARMRVLHTIEVGSPEVLPMNTEVPVPTARLSLTVFDFFHSAMAGNEPAVKLLAQRQREMGPNAGCDYYDGMIQKYQGIMAERMKSGQYTEMEVVTLHKAVKAFLKGQHRPAPRMLYIADCHFYHDRICREMDKRGFSNYEEMNRHMIRQWNGKVYAWDHVYILGDFSIGRAVATEKVLDQLNGRLHLIVGNHDKYLADKKFSRDFFRSIEPYLELHDKGRTVILSHYPVFCYKGQYKRDKQGNPRTFMLYGHVHNTHDERLVNQFILETKQTKVQSRYADHPEPIPCNMINCFCMFSDYQPMTLDEWIEIDRKRRCGVYRAMKHKTIEERAAEYGGRLNLGSELDWGEEPVH